MKDNLFNALKIAIAIAVLAVPSIGRPQGLSYYYSHNLLNTNTVIAGQMTTNFVAANYHVTGPYASTKGITANDPNATGYTFQLVTAQIVASNTIPQYPTNVVLTCVPVLDDDSIVYKYPSPTNQAFTVTLLASGSTNAMATMIQVPATNTLGAKQFKVVSAFYAGTNTLNLISTRLGYWY